MFRAPEYEGSTKSNGKVRILSADVTFTPIRKRFFTADTHFSSERTLKFSQRPFTTTQEMDEYIIKKWNDTVGVNDIVYHLGDFGNFDVVPQLNGVIKLLIGNYEREDDSYINASYKYGFEVFHSPFLVEFDNLEATVQDYFECVHEPSMSKTEYFVLFGHIHEKGLVKRNGMNVGTDAHHFSPVSDEKVLFYRNAILNHYDNEVFSNKCGWLN